MTTAATTLTGDLDPDHGRVVDAALTEARDAPFNAGHTNVTWADALVEMANRSLDATTTPTRRDRFRVNWFLDPTNPVPAHWTDGIAIPDWLRDHLTCDGTISPTFTADSYPVSVGHTVRDIPDRTRRLVLHRDQQCRVPGCAQTRWLQVHHIIHRRDGGANDTANLAALCPADHRLHHQGHLGITGDADQPNGLTFTDTNGDVIDPATHPTTPTRPPPTPPRPYEHPSVKPPTLGGRLPRPTPRRRPRRLTDRTASRRRTSAGSSAVANQRLQSRRHLAPQSVLARSLNGNDRRVCRTSSPNSRPQAPPAVSPRTDGMEPSTGSSSVALRQLTRPRRHQGRLPIHRHGV